MSARAQHSTESSPISAAALARIVDAARQAPSIHNSQPWSWVAHHGRLELWRDLSRRLPASDPSGRQQVISCGTGLHHALVAAHALALHTEVEHLPDPERPDLLARVTLSPGSRGREVELMRAIPERCTDRRRFTSWPLPAARVSQLADRASHWWAAVVPITEAVPRARVERLVEGARRHELRDEAVRSETARWIERQGDDGIPAAAIPMVNAEPGAHPNRYAEPSDDVDPLSLRSSDGLVVVGTESDDALAWLSAGTTLSDLWLRATLEGLSVVPLSQAIEDSTARDALRSELPAESREPQVLVRLGWQVISRSTLPRTPRRALAEVFHVR